MKLNDNGDFCLLYVEPGDEKQPLLEAIGAQTKPVVLLLPQVAGQPRSRLFQRPEDFSDLKHVRRQIGVPIIFLLSSSELLAQMAARYGFPSYPSIDAFAEVLAHGRRAEQEEVLAYPPRRARTGPLVPSAGQLAAIRRSTPTGPLRLRVGDSLPWPSPASGSLPVEDVSSVSQRPTAPLHAPTDIAFWPSPVSDALPDTSMPPPARRSAPATPIPPGREYNAFATAPLEDEASVEDEPAHAQRFSEIPRRSSARRMSTGEAYVRTPTWEPEDSVYDYLREPVQERPSASRGSTRSRPDARAAEPRTPIPDVPTQLPPAPPSEAQTTRPRRGSLAALIILSLLVIVGAGLGSLVVISHNAPVAPVTAQPVGSITFLSSEQLNENTSQGIDDEVQISLHNLANPAPGKSLYAWLLGDQDQSEARAVLLGKLNVVNGAASMLYPGDTTHTNLLQITSRFLVTEEESSPAPLMPSPDTSTWRYYGALPAIPDPNDPHHYAFLNHLRHLLADEPVLDEMELPGGLNNWFTRNSEKLIEWTSSARDRWQETHDLAFVRGEGLQILSYLDGMSFMAQDVPPASANVQVTLDTHLASLGLLNVRGDSQNPPSYMDQIVYHLNGLINAPGSPPSIRQTAASLLNALSNVRTWLQNLRSDDKKLLAMKNSQMNQPAALSLLDDMVLQASNAYTGSIDPTTGQLRQGVVWAHQQMQSMAKIDISTYINGSPVPEIAPSSQNAPSFLWPVLRELTTRKNPEAGL